MTISSLDWVHKLSKNSTVSVEQMVKHLAKSECLDELDAYYFDEILKAYFSLGRPSHFSQYKEKMLNAYLKLLQSLPVEHCFELTHQFFLYVRTNNPSDGDLENQNEINRSIFQPFKSNLAKMLPSIEVPRLHFQPNEDTYVIMTRHAMTQGMYAPGKQIYSVCEALLKVQKKVILVNFGQRDEKFLELETHSNFFMCNFRTNFNSLQSFFALRELIDEIRPTEIITEIELSVLNLLEAIGVSSKVCLLSAGVYQIPWFDKKYLVPELYSEDMSLHTDVVAIPQTHSRIILAPTLREGEIEQIRMELKLEGNFVFGSFARYEKFTPEFLNFAKRALNSVPDSMLILAGSNDRSIAEQCLANEIEKNKVILLGQVRTYVLGWLLDVFLDPFPNIAGFAALESLAKGKPVVTKECVGLGNYRKNRVQDLIFEDENKLLDALMSMAACKRQYLGWSKKSMEVAESLYNSEALADAICRSSLPTKPSIQIAANTV